ncbi:MAG TPA: sialidase family protein [Thermoanaerobaculia bacterium]|nr:sialidase family protein [Thermoanaerobaculia bacterium]
MRHVTVMVFVLLAFACTDRELGREESGVRVEAGTRVEPIDTPSGDGASAPSLSATSAGVVVMSWLEPVSGTDRVAVRVAEYRDGRWSPASNVVERNDLFVNWADFPSVVGDANGTLFAHWLQKSGPGTYAYDVRMSVSGDRGKSWSAPFLLNRDGTKTEHGFATLAPLPGGGVGATWLDGRNMKPGAHEHDAGEMTLRYATVDAAGSIGEDVELDSRACECCTTGMAMPAAGPVIVYRDRTAGEIRDISYVTKGSEGWSAPRTLHPDGWKIDGCPVNGPQIDAIGTRAAAAWFTAAGELGRVYVTFSGDGGGTFAPPLRVDDGNPAGRVDIVMLDEETALVAWLEQTPAGAEIRARRVQRGGDAIASVKIADSSTARAAGFPRLARVGGEVWFAWTDQTATTKRIRLARRRF